VTAARSRRRYLDWLRGVAVLIMIEAHTFDAWTRPADRELEAFGWALIIGGFGAPLFLFLAGVAAVLSASAKAARGASVRAASWAVQRRGWQIFGLAFLFRLQSYVVNPGSPLRTLAKVDILNIMGPSIAAAAALWGVVKSFKGRLLAFSGATVALAMMTPIVREVGFLGPLPDQVEAYLRPRPGLTNFAFFPWSGFVFAGGVVGLLLDRSRDETAERRLTLRLALGGALVAGAGYAASYAPSIYQRSSFWTSSPTFFFVRTGILVLGVAGAYVWEEWRGSDKWNPLAQLGRTSLFIYWIHIEMVYGVLATPLKRQLPLAGTFAAFLLFTLAMLGLSIAKTRIAASWRQRRSEPMKEVP
jgi:uncharacterized membrane protein